MARKPTKKMSAEAPRKKSHKGTIVLTCSIVVVTLLVFAMPTVMLLFFGMLPSFVAFIIDRTSEKYATFCVSAMNFTGLFPYMMDLWIGSHTILAAIDTLTNVFSLFVIYGSSGFGWLIFSSVPPVTSTILSAFNQKRVSTLRSRQRTLIGDWGEGVAHKDKSDTFDAETTAAGPSPAPSPA
ncbi:MAG: acyl-CoA synthetase [Rhodospirillales bacterium]|jgi:hypothetical protein|nr:acyl-CoA synthetase [Rhodospirillales bacterium]